MRPGHLIGSVDPGSPADAAGLQKDDKIVEVNGHNVLEDTHRQVVDHIKTHHDHVDLLVVDHETERFYHDKSIWVHSKMDNMTVYNCPEHRPSGKLHALLTGS